MITISDEQLAKVLSSLQDIATVVNRLRFQPMLAEGLRTSEQENHELPVPSLLPMEAGPLAQYEMLRNVRVRLDQIETMLSSAISNKSSIARLVSTARAEADAAWDKEIVRIKSSAARQSTVMESAKERAAEANIAVFDVRLRQQRAERVLTAAEACVDTVRMHYQGLNGLRYDIHALLKSTAYELGIDR